MMALSTFWRYVIAVTLVILGLILSTVGLKYAYPVDFYFTIAGLISAVMGAAVFYGMGGGSRARRARG